MRPVDQRHHHVLESCHSRQEVEVLKDEPDLPASQPGSLRLAEPRDVLTIKEVSAAGRAVEEPQEVDQRRLARTRRSHEGNHLAPRIDSETPLSTGTLIAPRV